jgi:L-threonylcarbamoyladenylate synthase
MSVIYDPSSAKQFERVIGLLKRGDAVGLPSETVYGLAALALQETSLAKIFALKNRPTFDPLIVHILNSADWVTPLVKNSTQLHDQLMKAFWPGPLTLLFEKSERVPDLCTASSDWVALRAPAHPLFQRVLKSLGQPLAAPSANRFGRISPTRSEDVVKELGPYGLEAVLEGGSCELGIESTVLKVVSDQEVEILRLGSLSMEAISGVLGSQVHIKIRKSGSGIDEKMESPGLLRSHYAPRTPLYVWDDLSQASKNEILRNHLKYGFLSVFSLDVVFDRTPWVVLHVLSPQGNAVEAATRLFRVLRQMDEQGLRGEFEGIIVKLAPPDSASLCPAIHDRLRRASSLFSQES